MALMADGTVSAWGANWNGQTDVPPDLSNVIALSAGASHSVALVSSSVPIASLLNPVKQGSRFSALIQTLNRKHYAFDFNDSISSTNWSAISTNPGNGALRMLTDPAATAPARFYRMRQW